METTATPQYFVDAAAAGEFLGLKPRRVLELARAGALPGYPLGVGTRRVWRFRLSELSAAMQHLAGHSSAYPAARRVS